MILVDSNVWVYAIDATMREHATVAKELPKLLEEHELLMPTLVQLEVAHFLVRRRGAAAHGALDAFLLQEAKVDALAGGESADAARFLAAHHESGIGGRDAAILLSARRNDAMLATNDKALARLARTVGIATLNPAGR